MGKKNCLSTDDAQQFGKWVEKLWTSIPTSYYTQKLILGVFKDLNVKIKVLIYLEKS